DDNHIDRMAEVVQNLQSVGLKVEQLMEGLGIITGSCDQTKVEEISQVEGVSHVEPDRQYQLAPPTADIQ
ncbi:MAG TPA: ketohydroxyglutarate aldolase, partial [Cyanobacteria bacterium UBA11368]|nr:ketohydroxyglutarate aldolase [Cyanobacteria bacterium UBA11368]